MIQVLASEARGFSRSTVCWIMERSPSSASTCLARARRERGQKRVPLPPASITGRKSIGFGIEESSYPTNTNFAQGRLCHSFGQEPPCPGNHCAEHRIEPLLPIQIRNFAPPDASRNRLLKAGQEFLHPARSFIDVLFGHGVGHADVLSG